MAIWKRLVAMLLMAAVVFGLCGCSQRQAVQEDEQQELKIRRLIFVTDDVEDHFSALAWEQLQLCAKNTGAQVTLLEVQHQADKASTALNQASEGLYDVVILDRLSGESATEWVRRNAGYYPDVQYLCLNSVPEELPELSNVTWLVWESAVVYYLYGAVAALNSQTGTVAFLGDETGVRSEHDFLAFYAGASRVSPGCRALYYTLNQAPGEQSMHTMLNTALSEQTDVLCTHMGQDTLRLMQVLDGMEQQPLLLAGDTSPDISAWSDRSWFLSGFGFDAETILNTVFLQCCADELKAGIQQFSLAEKDIHLVYSDHYPGTDDPDMLAEYHLIEREVRDGSLEKTLALIQDPDERQQKIAQAGENKEITN